MPGRYIRWTETILSMGNSEITYYAKDALRNAKTTTWGETTGNNNTRRKTNNVDEMESHVTRPQDISERRYTQTRYTHRKISDIEKGLVLLRLMRFP